MVECTGNSRPALYSQAGSAGNRQQAARGKQGIGAGNHIINAMIGTIYCQQGNYDPGISFIQKALHAAPEYANGHMQLAYCYQRNNRPREARIHFIKVIELKPDFSDPYLFVAALYEDEGNYLKAEEYYRLFLSHALPNNPLIPTAQSRLKELQ